MGIHEFLMSVGKPWVALSATKVRIKPLVAMIVVLGFLTGTHASDLGLQAENALLRSQLAARDVEIARLTVENAALRAQVEAVDSTDDLLEADVREAVGSVDMHGNTPISTSDLQLSRIQWLKRGATSSSGPYADWIWRTEKKALLKKKNHSGSHIGCAQKCACNAHWQVPARVRKRSKGNLWCPSQDKCKSWRYTKDWKTKSGRCELFDYQLDDHCKVFSWRTGNITKKQRYGKDGGGPRKHLCRGRCDLLPKYLDQKCVVTPRWAKDARSCVQRDKQAPAGSVRWKVYRHRSRKSKYGYDEVTCPCTQNGKAVTEEEALRHILGQAAAMKPLELENVSPDGRRALMPAFAIKVSVATFAMFNCWKKKCSAKGELNVEHTLLGDPVDLQLGDSYGGGTEC